MYTASQKRKVLVCQHKKDTKNISIAIINLKGVWYARLQSCNQMSYPDAQTTSTKQQWFPPDVQTLSE